MTINTGVYKLIEVFEINSQNAHNVYIYGALINFLLTTAYSS